MASLRGDDPPVEVHPSLDAEVESSIDDGVVSFPGSSKLGTEGRNAPPTMLPSKGAAKAAIAEAKLN